METRNSISDADREDRVIETLINGYYNTLRIDVLQVEERLEIITNRNKKYGRDGKSDMRTLLSAISPYAPGTETPFKRLPLKFHFQIFSFLNTTTALSCRIVCKRWEGLIPLAHTLLTVPEECSLSNLRILASLFPKISHILLPSRSYLSELEWSTFFSLHAQTGRGKKGGGKKIHIIADKVAEVSECMSLARAFRDSHKCPEHAVEVLTRALGLAKKKEEEEESSPLNSSSSDPSSVDIYFLRALANLENHDFQSCYDDCNSAIAAFPEGTEAPEIIALRGKALVELERFEEAIKDLDMALLYETVIASADGTFTGDWSAMDYRGEALRQLGRFESAIESFDKVLAANPNHACSFHSRALVKSELYQYHAAIADFTKAIELEPHEMSYCERAWAYYRIDKYEEVIKDCQAIQEIYQDSDTDKPTDNCFLQWCFALFELKRYQEAYEISLKAMEVDPDEALSTVSHAVALQGLKRYREAMDHFQRALELHPNDDWALVRRTKTFCHFQKHEEALEGLSQSLRRFPNNRSTLFHRAYVYEKLGRYREALQDLQVLDAEEIKLNISDESTRRQTAIKRRKRILQKMLVV